MNNNNILQIDGMSSARIRHFLNNMLELPDINYLEIGAARGSTLVSALFNNNPNSAYSIDFHYNDPDFTNNTAGLNFVRLEEDCFKIDLSKIKHPINMYLFDGGHTYEDHYKAIEYYYPVLADEKKSKHQRTL